MLPCFDSLPDPSSSLCLCNPPPTPRSGVICASEQSVVVVDRVYEAVKAEFSRRGAHFLSEAEKDKARQLAGRERGARPAPLGAACFVQPAGQLLNAEEPHSATLPCPCHVFPAALTICPHIQHVPTCSASSLLPPCFPAQVRAKMIVDGRLNADIVGQTAQRLGEIFGIAVPEGTKVLIGEVRARGGRQPPGPASWRPGLAGA